LSDVTGGVLEVVAMVFTSLGSACLIARLGVGCVVRCRTDGCNAIVAPRRLGCDMRGARNLDRNPL
jgi:hypothetical protein